jgi:hypothetical protein
MARLRRPDIRILIMAVAEAERHVGADWGEYLRLPTTVEELVEAARKAIEGASGNSH